MRISPGIHFGVWWPKHHSRVFQQSIIWYSVYDRVACSRNIKADLSLRNVCVCISFIRTWNFYRQKKSALTCRKNSKFVLQEISQVAFLMRSKIFKNHHGITKKAKVEIIVLLVVVVYYTSIKTEKSEQNQPNLSPLWILWLNVIALVSSRLPLLLYQRAKRNYSYERRELCNNNLLL